MPDHDDMLSLLTNSYALLDRCHYRLTEMMEAPVLRTDIEAHLIQIRCYLGTRSEQ